MKKLSLSILAFQALLLTLTGCVEKAPLINMGGGVKIVDTTYVAPIESVQPKTVYVEEFTGASCPNCPAAAQSLENIAANHDGHMIIASLHIFNKPPVGDPYPGSKYDFRTQKSTDIGNAVYGNVPGLPNAGVDRAKSNGVILFDKPSWAAAIDDRFNMTPAANISVMAAYDNTTRNATVKLHVAYTQHVINPQFITVLVVEDSITDIQETKDTVDHQYNFMHIVRDYLTSIAGDKILSGVAIDKGRVYERTLTFNVNAAWKPGHCKVIAFVHNYQADNKEIIQTAEAALKP